MSRPRARRGEAGQSLLEFALVLPVFLVMLFGILDIGRVVWAYDAMANAAREAARYASVHGDNDDVITCPTGPNLDNNMYVTGCPAWTPDSKEPTRVVARNYLVAAGAGVVVRVCYYTTTDCSGDTDETDATNGRGAFVKVTITSTVPVFTGALIGRTGFGVSATSTVLINN